MNKVSGTLFFSVKGANPNGDPASGNVPRMDRNGNGVVTGEAIKHKSRTRAVDMGLPVVVQANDRATDGHTSIQARTEATVGKLPKEYAAARDLLTGAFIDVRWYGGVFAWKSGGSDKGISIGVRGPITFWMAKSVDPIIVEDIQITKSTNGAESDKGRGSDTMGMKHIVEFGLYRMNFSISAQLADVVHLTDEDVEHFRDTLLTLFEGDESAARPDGTMVVEKVFWFEHDGKVGNSRKVFDAIHVNRKDGIAVASDVSDYDIVCDDVPGGNMTVYEGN